MFRLPTFPSFSTATLFVSLSVTAQTPGPRIPTPAKLPNSIQNQAPAQTPPNAMLPPAATAFVPAPQATPEEIGDSLEARQRYQAAIAAYAKASPPSAVIWNKMGIAYQMLFNLKDATRCYKESLKLDRRNAMVLNNLGTVYDSQKDYKAAEHMYRKALKINPKSAFVLKNLGTNLLVQHRYDKGWDEYKKALALDPRIFEDNGSPKVENPTTVEQRGAMNYFMARGCLRAGQTECAIQYLRMALDEGYTNVKKLAADIDFSTLHDNPAFKELLAEQQNARSSERRQ
jgi:tetratricopeptide (TPR) repeat protein